MVTAVLIVATALSGCSKSTNDPNSGSTKTSPTPGTTTNAEEGESSDIWEFGSSELSFSAFQLYNWQDFPATMDDNPFWKYLKENKKLNIKSVLGSSNNLQLMATMMANDNLPDLIHGDRNHPDFLKLYKEGKLVALDDYMEKYPNLKKWLSSEAADLLRSPDGKLYQFPNYYTTIPNGAAGYVVNKKIYKELGSPSLETMDDLYAYLVKVKEKYGNEIVPFEPDQAANANGIGLIYTGHKENSYYRSLSSGTIAVVDDANNKLSSLYTDPAFRESQKFVSKLYREKLISQDMFTAVDRAGIQERVLTGRVAIYAASSPLTWAMQGDTELSAKDPDAGYFVTWPIHKAGLDKNKIFTGSWDKLGWNVNVITTAAEEPEKIFAWLDWMTGPEGMATQYFGPEGGNWNGFDENDRPIFTDTYNKAEVAKLETDNVPVIIVGNTTYIDPIKMDYEMAKPEAERSWLLTNQEAVTWRTTNDATALATNLTPQAGTDLADIDVNVREIFAQALSASATAKSDADVDKILDQAQEDSLAVGYGELLEWRTEQWLKNKELLGE